MRLQTTYPRLTVRVALSPRALDFVTTLSLEGITGALVYTENRPLNQSTGRPTYLDLVDADALILYPATARVLAHCALGIVSCPVTRCFAFADKKSVLVTPYLHPRMEPRLYSQHVDVLRSVGCTVVQPDDRLFWRTTSAWVTTEHRLSEMLKLEAPCPPPTSWAAADDISGDPSFNRQSTTDAASA